MSITVNVLYVSEELVNAIKCYLNKNSISFKFSHPFLYIDLDIGNVNSILKEILHLMKLADYGVYESLDNPFEVTILKKDSLEQFGFYSCSHCGQFFSDEYQKSIHERSHYFL